MEVVRRGVMCGWIMGVGDDVMCVGGEDEECGCGEVKLNRTSWVGDVSVLLLLAVALGQSPLRAQKYCLCSVPLSLLHAHETLAWRSCTGG